MCSIDIQCASDASHIPALEQIELWAKRVLDEAAKDAELSIRIVDEIESQNLNHQYRHKNQPTNVLSFPCEVPQGVECKLLGDLVICAPVVASEAKAQGKNLCSHWAHMVIHGTLHLLGYDHIRNEDAEIMEQKEIHLMKALGYSSPYEDCLT